MIIHSKLKEYDVNIVENFEFYNELLNDAQSYWVIDRRVYELYKELFIKLDITRLMLLDATETNKNINTALSICDRMTELSGKRNVTLISLGGGIIQDITGFAANILYRGIKWIFIPTTLLASCDSCIGGKTSLNYKCYKNLLGTFYPPDSIFVNSQFLKTLSEKDFLSGLGEVLKFNIMAGKGGINKIQTDLDALLRREEGKLNEYIKNSLLFKKEYIEKDEFDKGVRVYLNFAHTFGHAIESVSDYKIPHGTAVAIGMLIANRISLCRGILQESIVHEIEVIIKRIVHTETKISEYDTDAIIDAMRKDKKQAGTSLTAILLDGNFQLELYHDLQKEEILKAIHSVANLL